MARTEQQMEEELNGMAAPSPEMGTATETSPTIDMETMMGNFMDMDEELKPIATRLIASPAAELVDQIIGQPTLTRLRNQLDQPLSLGAEEAPTPEPQAEGMMAPTATEEEATAPPV